MIFPLLLALLATAGGALASYLYDEGASFASRICTGVCIGLAALGLIGFVVASFLGLTPMSIAISMAVVISPALVLLNPARREQVQYDLSVTIAGVRRAVSRPSGPEIAYFLYYAIAAVIFWQIFGRAMIEKPEGIYTGLLNNFGDLPFHLSVISGFAHGNNFPPDDPTYSGVRFTYPFLTDFIAAIFVRCGSSLRDAMFVENYLVALAFVGVLHRWACEMLRNRVAALITPLLVFLNGGLGFLLFFRDAGKNPDGIVGALTHLAPSFTIIPDTAWRWGNAISTLLVPQRGMLLGLPLAVIVFTQWWLATGGKTEGEKERRGDGEKGKNGGQAFVGEGSGNAGWGARKHHYAGSGKSKKKKGHGAKVSASREASDLRISPSLPASPTTRMIGAGVIAAMLPLVHAHSFVAVMVVGATIALLHLIFLQTYWREWIVFGLVASAIALPQLWWSTHQSAVNSSTFFSFSFGWDSGKENYFDWKLVGSQFLETKPWLRIALERAPDVALFWLKNAGLFIPLLLGALFWRGKKPVVSRRLLLFYLPFTLCFIIPNVVKLAPWVWDNIKVLFYWWVAAALLVALLLARLWRAKQPALRALSVVLFGGLILAGALDVASIVARTGEYQVFDSNGMQFAELIKQQTEPRALLLHAPVHNDPVFLTGRRSFMGYPGHIWTHGLEFAPREAEIKRIYSGAPGAEGLLGKNHIDYVVVGPLERAGMTVNEEFFSRFRKVGEVGEYRLYKISQP